MCSDGICHLSFVLCPEKFFKRHGMHGFLTNSAREGQVAFARGDTKLAAGCADAPSRTRKEAEGVERSFAKLNFIEQDECVFLANRDTLVVCNASHDGIDFVCRPLENRCDKIEVGLKVEFDKRVAGNSFAHLFGYIRFTDAACATYKKRTGGILGCPLLNN